MKYKYTESELRQFRAIGMYNEKVLELLEGNTSDNFIRIVLSDISEYMTEGFPMNYREYKQGKTANMGGVRFTRIRNGVYVEHNWRNVWKPLGTLTLAEARTIRDDYNEVNDRIIAEQERSKKAQRKIAQAFIPLKTKEEIDGVMERLRKNSVRS
ncbi:hypothetical protein VCHA38O209_50264 [Vibrio chagasii]|nr:hypothetical protein VCHA38O209_50264 [Vibrio chagasii]